MLYFICTVPENRNLTGKENVTTKWKCNKEPDRFPFSISTNLSGN